MFKSDQLGQLADALSKAQGQMGNAKKDSANPFFKSKYADLASVVDASKAELTANGLAVVQLPTMRDGKMVLEYVLLHSSGEFIGGELEMTPVKSDPQGIGSAITYARRYTWSSLTGVATEDDDGNAASGKDSRPSRPTAERSTEEKPLTRSVGGQIAQAGHGNGVREAEGSGSTRRPSSAPTPESGPKQVKPVWADGPDHIPASGPKEAVRSTQEGKAAGPVVIQATTTRPKHGDTDVNWDTDPPAAKVYADTFDPVAIEVAAEAKASMEAKAGMVPDGCVDVGQAANFAKSFKDALPSKFRKQADDIRHEWLKKQGIVDSLGEPTSKAIRKENFYDVREEAEIYASNYGQ